MHHLRSQVRIESSVVSNKYLGSQLEEGVSLKVLSRIINRLKKKYPDGVIRVTKSNVCHVRHTKHRAGYTSEYPMLDESEQRLNDIFLVNEDDKLKQE